jgi:hypothetical protein
VPDVQPDISQQVTSISTYFDPRPEGALREGQLAGEVARGNLDLDLDGAAHRLSFLLGYL